MAVLCRTRYAPAKSPASSASRTTYGSGCPGNRSPAEATLISAATGILTLALSPIRAFWWSVVLISLGLLIETAIVLLNHLAAPDAAVVLEGDPRRIRYAARFSKGHANLPIYISSEPVFYQVYRDALAEEQVPIERFALRTCATDTLTNFTCIMAELKAHGFRHVYLITSAHHMARALTIGRIVLGRKGIAVTPLPVGTNRNSREPLARILRDALRAVLWSITRITGPEKTIHPPD